jgi:pimeloyl-ACP methyl ester carboxylesterase
MRTGARRRFRRIIEESVAGGGSDDDVRAEFESLSEYVELAVRDALEWDVRELLCSDPAADLARVDAPVLALWGAIDRHLDSDLERAAFRSAAPPGARSEILPGLKHLFQQSKTGATLRATAHRCARLSSTWWPTGWSVSRSHS